MSRELEPSDYERPAREVAAEPVESRLRVAGGVTASGARVTVMRDERAVSRSGCRVSFRGEWREVSALVVSGATLEEALRRAAALLELQREVAQ